VSSKQINTIRKTPGAIIWQRNYFERVIRNKDELRKIREYIVGNPLTWEQDKNYNATS
jgi:putative transposase